MSRAIAQSELKLGKGKLRLWKVAPGPSGHQSAITSFLTEGGGYITALEESALKVAGLLVPENEDAEVIGFGTLAGVVCRWVGLPTLPVARASLVEASVSLACSTVGSIFRGQAAAVVGMSQAVSATLSELRYVGATRDSLHILAEDLDGQGNSTLAHRIRELGTILKSSNETLGLLGREHLSDQLRRLVDSSPAQFPTFEVPERLLVLAIQELSPLHAEWLRWLANAGSEVTCIIEAQAGGGPLFSTPIQQLNLGSALTEEPGATVLADRLFTILNEPAQAISELDPTLEIVACADRLSECEWALRDCAQALSEGLPASEIAITFRDEAYGPLLLSAARRLQVPVRLNVRAPLLANRLVAFILSLFKAFASPDVRELIPPFESIYAELSSGSLRRMRKMIREAYKAPDPWKQVEDWSASSNWAPPWLEPALEWRREALGLPEMSGSIQESLDLGFLEPEDFPHNFELELLGSRPSSVPTSEWLQRIRILVELLPVLDAPEHESTSWDNRAQKVMIQTLLDEASVDKARKRAPLDFAQAVKWCEQVWSRTDCSVPAQDDGILVSTNSQSLMNVSYLRVLGMSDGKFPKRASADPVLPDWERKCLQALGVQLPTSEEAHHGREREEFVRICSAATSHLTLSFPRALDDRESGPSSFVAEAKRVAKQSNQREEKGVVPELERCHLGRDAALRKQLDQERVLPQEVELGDAKAELLKLPVLKLRTQEAMDAATCAFRYQARKLGILQEGIREFPFRLAELPVSTQLWFAKNPEEANTKLEESLDELLERYRGQAEPWELKMYRLQGKRYIRSLVKREFKAREVWPREIDPSIKPDYESRYTVEDGELCIMGRVSVVGQIDGRRSYHLFRPSPIKNQSGPAELLESALAALVKKDGGGSVVEVDSRNERELISNPKLPDPPPAIWKRYNIKSHGLKVVKTEKLQNVLDTAARVAKRGEMSPTPHEGCVFCDFGELCRRSKEFSEVTSPFGADAPKEPNAY